MYDYNEAEELKIKLKTIGQWAISGFLDALFLVSWVVIQWVVQKVIVYLNLYGIDEWMLIAFQILFSVATLVPVIAYIVKDIFKVILRTWGQIEYDFFLLQEFRNKKLKSLSGQMSDHQRQISDSINTEEQPDDSQNV